MPGASATIATIFVEHGGVVVGWLFALAALVFHFFVNRRRHAVIDAATVFLFGFLLTTLCHFRLFGDDLEYATIARNLAGGDGLVDASGTVFTQRPGYVLLYAAAYAIGGLGGIPFLASLGFAALCTAAFCFGRLVYGTAASAVSIIGLLLLPREILEAGIDSIAGGFAFTAFALLVLPPGRRELGIGLGAALVLALAFSCKEVAVLAAGFPALLLLGRADRALTRRLVAALTGSLLLIALIALAERHFAVPAAPYFDMTSERLPFAVEAPLAYALSLVKGVAAYFWWPAHNEALLIWAPVFVVLPPAVVLIGYRAVGGNRSDRIVLAALLIWLPLIGLVGARDWRPEQALNFLALGYLAVAELASALAGERRYRQCVLATTAIVIAGSGLVQSLAVDRALYARPGETPLERTVMGRLAVLRPLRFETELSNGANLAAIGVDVATGAKVWASPIQRTGLVALLASDNRFRVAPVPLHALIRLGYATGYLAFSNGWVDRVTRPIWGVYAAAGPGSPLFILYRDDLAAGFRDVPLVLIDPTPAWTRDLANLLAERLLRKVREVPGGAYPVSAYRWDREAVAENLERSFVDRHALALLNRWRSEHPELFAWYRQQLRAGGIALDAAAIDALLAEPADTGNPVFALPAAPAGGGR